MMRNPTVVLRTMGVTMGAMACACVASPVLPAATLCAYVGDQSVATPITQCGVFPTVSVDFDGRGTASATSLPHPVVRAEANYYMLPLPTVRLFPDDTSAGADLDYYIAIDGPATSLLVPLRVSGTVAAFLPQPISHGTFAGAWAEVNLSGGGVDLDELAERGVTLGMGRSGSDVVNFDTEVMVPVNTPLLVSMSAAANSHEAFGGDSAYADPTFTIDPAFLAANPGYALAFSPGVGNGPAVPEPLSLVLFGFGLVGLRAVCRRRVG